MANFKQAFDITMGHEGGYSNNVNDKGGETYRGIARKYWPNWSGWVLIDAYKKSGGNPAGISPEMLQIQVEDFYKKVFWDSFSGDKMTDQELANELFDTGVNMGDGIARKFLQEALNLCNNDGKLYPNLTVDGSVGPATLNSLAKANAKRVLATMNLLQGERYLNIMRNNETQEEFWGGWLKRVIVNYK